MLFNSVEFLFFFLPVTMLVYFGMQSAGWSSTAKSWLFLASLFFYGWWNPFYLPIILGSMAFNFFLGKILNRKEDQRKKLWLTLGIVVNVGLLVFFKYTNFLIDNINLFTGDLISMVEITLPLAISFFTFQQIAYLVDSYKGMTGDYNFFNYGLFVSFFPQLIAGPIVHHKEMMPQFYDRGNERFSYENFTRGLYVFFMGLCKKMAIADSFAIFANAGYGNTAELSLLDGWITSLAYSGQLYFDFSGYTDMAIGAALMFNIKIPINFNSPYKALSIQDFWRRWHMTLSRFLRDYIYIPLGGNRNGEYRTMNNLMMTFLIGGLWHGAGWTFIFWGFLHGFGLIIHRLWQNSGIKIPNVVSWFITFNFVNVAWVFFRATTWADAINVLAAMFGFSTLPAMQSTVLVDIYAIPMAMIGVVLLFYKNTNQLAEEFKFNNRQLVSVSAVIILGILFFNSITSNDFLYFDF